MLFSMPTMNAYELKVIEDVEKVRDALKYSLSALPRWNGLLRRTTLARNIQGSNSIEGYSVTVEDAIAAIEAEEPLEAQSEAWMAVSGYRGAMTYVLQLADDPHFSYNEGFLRSLHFMMLSYDLAKRPGRWRPGPIYVREEATGRTVYEGPPAENIPELVRELIDQLNTKEGSPIVRAAMAHLNFVMIHPFSDGNGRMARCLQTLVLARQGIIEPWFCSIEEYLGRNTQPYYGVLAKVGQGGWHPENDARPWLHFCLTAHFRQANTLLRRSKEMRKMWDEMENLVQRRGLPDRVIFALADAAIGFRVRNATYRRAADITDTLASRDLKLLVDAGLISARGEKKGRVYVAAQPLREIREKTREPRALDDPSFGPTPYFPGLEPKPETSTTAFLRSLSQ